MFSCLEKNFGNLDYDDDLYILSAADEYNGYNVPNSDGGWATVTNTGVTTNLPFYVYENTNDDYKTLLVVAAQFSYLNRAVYVLLFLVQDTILLL